MSDITENEEYATVISIDDYLNATVSKVRIVGWTGTGNREPIYGRLLSYEEYGFIERSDGSFVPRAPEWGCALSSLAEATQFAIQQARWRLEQIARDLEDRPSDLP